MYILVAYGWITSTMVLAYKLGVIVLLYSERETLSWWEGGGLCIYDNNFVCLFCVCSQEP